MTIQRGMPKADEAEAVQFGGRAPCSFRLLAISHQYFSLRTNQPPAISQQYFSLRTNQHKPSATSQTNRLVDFLEDVLSRGCGATTSAVLLSVAVCRRNESESPWWWIRSPKII
jgi:hypothetical protein